MTDANAPCGLFVLFLAERAQWEPNSASCRIELRQTLPCSLRVHPDARARSARVRNELALIGVGKSG
jgi:hypothetical protein